MRVFIVYHENQETYDNEQEFWVRAHSPEDAARIWAEYVRGEGFYTSEPLEVVIAEAPTTEGEPGIVESPPTFLTV